MDVKAQIEKCKGCRHCFDVCPVNVFVMHPRTEVPDVVGDTEVAANFRFRTEKSVVGHGPDCILCNACRTECEGRASRYGATRGKPTSRRTSEGTGSSGTEDPAHIDASAVVSGAGPHTAWRERSRVGPSDRFARLETRSPRFARLGLGTAGAEPAPTRRRAIGHVNRSGQPGETWWAGSGRRGQGSHVRTTPASSDAIVPRQRPEDPGGSAIYSPKPGSRRLTARRPGLVANSSRARAQERRRTAPPSPAPRFRRAGMRTPPAPKRGPARRFRAQAGR